MTLLRYDFRVSDRQLPLIPHVSVQEEAQRYLLRADLPGVLPADIEITTEDGVLTLKATRHNPDGTYLRRFTLPEDAAPEHISARSSHGVLEISVAKQPKVEPRRITVEAARSACANDAVRHS